jgi:ribosomal protein L7/L12
MTLTENEAMALYPFVQRLTVHELRASKDLYTAVMKIASVAVERQETNTGYTGISQWERDAINYLVGGNKVNAIKETRAALGLGLKEAKDVCDAIGEWITTRNPHSFSDQQLQDAYNRLRVAATAGGH